MEGSGWERILQPSNFPPLLRSSSSQSSIYRRKNSVGFKQARAASTQPEQENMEKNQTPPEKHGDVMSHSFGEAYSTRSDEEGFGGIYGGNQTFARKDKEQEVHENHAEYDKSQGSEVKEKEKGRNQTEEMVRKHADETISS